MGLLQQVHEKSVEIMRKFSKQITCLSGTPFCVDKGVTFVEQTFSDEVIVMERAVQSLDLTHNKICMSFFITITLNF